MAALAFFSLRIKLRSLCVVLALATSVIAQNAVPSNSGAAPSEDSSTEALQKAAQNPVASLISVPLQNNMNLEYGCFNRTQDVLNIQPVIPVGIGENWNLITRIIQPRVWQPYPDQNTGGEYGLGDMNPAFFLSPAKPGKLIWGAGPTMVIPTATSNITGQGQFSLGPSLVVLAQPPHWTLGALINNVWSVAAKAAARRSIRCCCSTSLTTT